MAVTPYASQGDLEDIWSPFGVSVRLDDDQDGHADSGVVGAVLEQGAVEVNKYLLRRYAVGIIASSAFAKWANAYISAVKLGKRRGNPIPESMAEEAQAYIDELILIRDGKAHLTTDTGLATPLQDHRPSVSNMTIDGRHVRQKVRRQAATSVGPEQDPSLKRNNEEYVWPGQIFTNRW